MHGVSGSIAHAFDDRPGSEWMCAESPAGSAFGMPHTLAQPLTQHFYSELMYSFSALRERGRGLQAQEKRLRADAL